MKSTTITSVLLVAIFLGCNREEQHLLSTAETVLPGNWYIEAVELPGTYGTTYQGSTIRSDTIIFDVGTIEIDQFSIAELEFDYAVPGVNCSVEILNEEFPYMIKHIFISGSEIFAYFRWNGPQGAFEISTPVEEFIWSSHIFNANYYVVVKDNDHIQLEKGNDRERHVIHMVRM